MEVVGRGGDVEPCWIEELVDVRVQRRHGGDWGWGVDEGGVEDSHG